jgi:glycosyltransferase involved in cell wall biosynthesis
VKVALLHYAAPPVVGGVESVLAAHARLMQADGCQVHIFAGRGAQTSPNIAFNHLPLIDSRHPAVLAVKQDLDQGRVTPAFYRLTDEIEGCLSPALADVDVLIAHNVCSLSKNLALTAALKRIAGRPGAPRLILWHHDLAWTTPRYRAELHEGFPWDLLRTDWPGAVQVVVSQLRREELAGLLEAPLERIRVVPNGVEPARLLKLEPQTVEIAHRLDLWDARPLLLLPVRITPRKNIELALRALAILRRDFLAAALVVTGPLGPHNPANREYFSSLLALRGSLNLDAAAHFLAELLEGYLPDAVIADFYHLADLLFLPSREEGFGIPVLEAGLMRLPVVCTDIPPLRGLGGDQATYFPPEGGPEEAVQAIAARLSEDRSYQMNSRVRAEYTWESIYQNQIRPLLEAGQGART